MVRAGKLTRRPGDHCRANAVAPDRGGSRLYTLDFLASFWAVEPEVKRLEPPDALYFEAAVGWLMLENLDEARRELDSIHPAHQRRPDVLELRWILEARRAAWQQCLTIARSLIEVAPDRPSGYLHQAYALRRIPEGGLKCAWEALRPAADKFPSELLVVYNLACYACQMGDPAAARQWLKGLWEAAAAAGETDRWVQLALGDQDLEPLWPEIRSLGKAAG